MADNSVFITGAASGAFTDALGDLPPWATQNTAESIERVLKKTLDIQTKALSALVKGSSGKGSGQQKALDDELTSLIKNLVKENASFGPRRKFWKDDEDNNNRRRKYWKDEEAANSLLIHTLSYVSSAGLLVKKAFEDNVNTFDALYQSGINVVAGFDSATSGFNALQQMATLTGVRYTELAKTMTKYNAAVNAFGTQRFAKTLTDASKNLGSFGYTTKETADLLGAYLETQRGFTDVRSRTEAQVQSDLVKFGKRITNVSLATGIARDKLLQHVEAISQTTEAMILSGNAGAAATDETLAFIGSFKDQNVGQAFLRMMTDSIKPLNDTFMSFQKTGFGGFGQELMNFTQSLVGLDPTEAQKRVAQFAETNKAEMDAMVKQANLLRQAGLKAESDDVLSKIAGIRQQARTYREMTDAQRSTLKATTEASTKLRNSWETFQAQAQITFAPLADILDLLTKALTGINTAAAYVRDIVGNTGAAWIGFGAAVIAVVSSMKLLTSGFKLLSKHLFSSKDADSGRGSTNRRGKRRGRDPVELAGQGIGAGVGNALSGLARGLSALGTPKVLLGVTALAGIGAALWVTGKAVQQFVGLKWEDLAKAGVAIAGITAAAALAGAGSELVLLGAAAFAALGASLWVVGKAIDSISSGITSIGSIFTTVGSGISVLTKALDGFTNLDKLKSIVSTINSIEILKAAAFGALSKMNAVSLPAQTSSVGVSVPTSPKASTLTSPSNTAKPDATPKTSPVGSESAPGIEKSAKATDINSAIAFQSSILEQLLVSNNSLLSVNKDILRYTKSHM